MTDRQRAARWFRGICLLHLGVWTLVPALIYPNLPLDAVEMTFWGHAWQWGYHKHPPLPAWIAETFSHLGGAWGVYLACQLSVVAALYCAWRLARDLLEPEAAVIAAVCLEACFYYSQLATEYNNNVGQMPFWALATLGGWLAVRSGRARDWLLLGVGLGLALLCKYTAAFLALSIAGYLLCEPAARRWWRTPGPYLAMAACLLIFLPHLCWMASHDFITLRYATQRAAASGAVTWRDHLVEPAKFIAAQLMALAPVLIIFGPLCGWRMPFRHAPPEELPARRYLWWAVGGPMALQTMLSLCTGMHLRSMWGATFWTFAGVLMLHGLVHRTDAQASRRALTLAVTACLLLLASTVVTAVGGPHAMGRAERIHFPGARLARTVTEGWHRRHAGPLPLVAGEWWLAGNVGFYSADRPLAYGDLSPMVSPWCSDAELRRRGGVLVWDTEAAGDALPLEWRERFPRAEPGGVLILRQQTGAMVPPARVGVAYVAPGG